MTKREKISSYIDDGPALFLEPDMFDNAILGVTERCGQPRLIAYDRQRCIEIIMAENSCDRDEAQEIFDYNAVDAWVGEGTPIFIDTSYAE